MRKKKKKKEKPKHKLSAKSVEEVTSLNANINGANVRLATAQSEMETYLRGIAHAFGITSTFYFDPKNMTIKEDG